MLNYEIWDLLEEFDIGDAVFLLAEVEPGSKVEVQRIQPYARLLHSAVQRGELPARLDPRGLTISREALLAFFKKKGKSPPLLFPEERHKSTHSADVGRPTNKKEIEEIYEALRDAGEIDYDARRNTLYEKIRNKAGRGRKGFGDEVIRRAIKPLFDRDKELRGNL